MQTKRKTTVYIDAALIEQAKELGINFSKILKLVLRGKSLSKSIYTYSTI